MENRRQLKLAFVSWISMHRRSMSIAKAFGADDYYIEYLKGVPRFLTPVRYLMQSLKTWQVLMRDRPDVILTQNPPVFSALTIHLFTKMYSGRLIIDSHTGAFAGGWRWFLPLHRYLSRRSITTIVTNSDLQDIVQKWGAHSFILEDRIPELPITEPVEKSDDFRVCFINSYMDDEPLEEVLAAAKRLPDVTFYITGKISRAKPGVLNDISANIVLTDFLPDHDYFELLNRVDAIMVLTKRDLTMLCGAYESVAVGKPLILSDWEVLKAHFSKGAIYVDNSTESIMEATQEARARNEELADEIHDLKMALIPLWDEKFKRLQEHIYSSFGPSISVPEQSSPSTRQTLVSRSKI